jgi:hypothetical protein
MHSIIDIYEQISQLKRERSKSSRHVCAGDGLAATVILLVLRLRAGMSVQAKDCGVRVNSLRVLRRSSTGVCRIIIRRDIIEVRCKRYSVS